LLVLSADLRRNIENLEKNSVTSLRTLVNLGSKVYLQAEVPNTQHIFVDVGLGFHVEFTWSEALNYMQKREETIAKFAFEILSNSICLT
ncbi:protein UXT homolog, partial [Arachis ipaensis]|uniref:protein UXT homolog n=1 Tax=Arachis ipaensis TaxID=130454 RepID=UPI000A2B8DB9